MDCKYFRFNMSDDNEDTLWGYATGSGEYIGSDSEDVSLDLIEKIPYDEASGVLRSWLKDCGAITNTLEIDNAVADAFSVGSTSAVFRYDNGDKYHMTIETADNPLVDWEEIEDGFDEEEKEGPYTGRDAVNGEAPYAKAERLWKEATGKEPTAPLAGLTNQKRAIHKDGRYIVIDISRSDEEIKEAIRDFLA